MVYNQSHSGRIEYLDIAKALGIACVILGHEASSIGHLQGLKSFTYAFHMPLFFALYGMTRHIRSDYTQTAFREFLSSRFFRLMFPYFLWGLIYCDFSYGNVIKIAYGTRQMLYSSGSLTSLWFLPVVFLVAVFFELLCVLAWKTKKREATFVAASLIGLLLLLVMPNQDQYGYPWGANVAICGCLFSIVGYYLRILFDCIYQKSLGFWLAFSIVSFLVLLVYRWNNYTNSFGTTEVNMCMNEYGNLFLFFVSALGGTLLILCISILLERCKWGRLKSWILYLGVNSIAIYILHKPFLQFINPYIKRLSGNMGMDLCISIVVTCLFSVFATVILNKYCPFVWGVRPVCEDKKS